jgi:hypothetical protein
MSQKNQLYIDYEDGSSISSADENVVHMELEVADVECDNKLPQEWTSGKEVTNISEARLIKTKPLARGKGYTAGKSKITSVIFNDQEADGLLLDSGAFCSIVSKKYLKQFCPEFVDQLLPIGSLKLNSASSTMKPVGIFPCSLIIPHVQGAVRIPVEFIVVEDGVSNYFILGNDYMTIYGFDITNSRERYFTIGNDNKMKKFLFKQRDQLAIQEVGRNPGLDKFFTEQLQQSKICEELTPKKVLQLQEVLFAHKNAFASDSEPLGAVIGHEVDITLNIERPYPPLLRRPAYPASPRARVELEKHIADLINLNFLRKIGHRNHHTCHHCLA